MTGPQPPASPLDPAGFAAAMDRFGPFEPAVRFAVGVSGGPDSLALCLLADGWARARGGAVLALTVDHGLRPDSGHEAARVAGWLAARGIAQETLRWDGVKPAAGLQAAARAARHRLLAERCRELGILHLALAHQAEDQAETLLLRLSRGSGPDGLAGMAVLRETEHVRLLRPLLGVPRARLEATCRAFGQDWIADPSNASPRFARARLRAVAPILAAEGLDAAALGRTARRAGAARAALERATAGLAARHARLHPEGWAELDPAALAEGELSARLLAGLLAAVGGGAREPRREAVERLLADLGGALPASARTVAGCRLSSKGGRLLIVREEARVAEEMPLAPGGTAAWDGRFLVGLGGDAPTPAAVGALGAAGLAALAEEGVRTGEVPAAVCRTLPAFRREGQVVAVPHLSYVRRDWPALACLARWRPAEPVSGAWFNAV